MIRLLRIAAREYGAYVRTAGFWLSMLMMPAIGALSWSRLGFHGNWATAAGVGVEAKGKDPCVTGRPPGRKVRLTGRSGA